MSLARRHGDLERTVGLAVNDGLPAADDVVRAGDGVNCTLAPARGPSSSVLDHLAPQQNTARQLDIHRPLDGPLVPFESMVGDQVRLAFGRIGADAVILAGRYAGRESARLIGRKPPAPAAPERVDARADADARMGNRRPCVGGQRAALDDRRGLENISEVLQAIRISRVDLEILAGEPLVADIEVNRHVAADSREREAACFVGLDGTRPVVNLLCRRRRPSNRRGDFCRGAVRLLTINSTPPAGAPFQSMSLPRMGTSDRNRISPVGSSASGLGPAQARPKPGAAATAWT